MYQVPFLPEHQALPWVLDDGMPKSKQSGGRRVPAGMREAGLRAFQSGHLDQAITYWATLSNDPEVRPALAEALFRRALSGERPDALDDMRRAAQLAPDDRRFQFHLGRLLHKAGTLPAAEAQYRAILERDPSNAAAARLLALITLEQHPYANLESLPGMTGEIRQWAAPAQAILRDKEPPADDSPIGSFWHGLSRVAAGDPEARALLSDDRPLPAPKLFALRRYYRGVAAAQAGEKETALKLWQQAYETGRLAQKLADNLAALVYERLAALNDAGDVAAAGALALQWVALPGGVAFDELRILTLDRAARARFAAGDWIGATQHWEAARQILGQAQSLGSPRPILHNLALTYERREAWEQAADTWRALLRTRARKRDAADAAEAERWAWVRKRIIDCYKNAGRPDEAVTVFRQALKADPNDLDLRIQLVDALMANEQDRAAFNELNRIIQIDPNHPEALLRLAEHHNARWDFAEAERLARQVAEHHPNRPDILRQVAQLFLQQGRQRAEYGQFAAAYQNFVEGERYQPDNPRFPINQARMLIIQRKPVDLDALLERALATGSESPDTWPLVLETWLMADKLNEARSLIERFERERRPDAQGYIALGTAVLARAIPRPPLPNPFSLTPPPPPKAIDTPWTALGQELLNKAVALNPDDPSIQRSIAAFLILLRPDLARPFAEAVVRLSPDDPEAFILLGMVQALAEQTKEAKATLQQAIQLARRKGRPDLQEQAKELRRAAGTPLLRMMLYSGLAGLGPDDDDEFLEDMLDDEF